MTNKKSMLDIVMDLLIRRGFIAPTAEIYSGLAGFFDYGPIGVKFKRNIENSWREFFVFSSWDPLIYEIDGSVVLPEEVLVASGHVSSFSDPIVSCDKCNSEHRADHLVEKHLGKNVEGLTATQLQEKIKKQGITCPNCKGSLSPVEDFNLMLKTDVGASKNSKRAYLRPETAQSIFINFKRVSQTMRAKIPFGIAQIGRSYRNEISPRQGLIRLRGFTQMEIEFFFDPDDQTHAGYDSMKETRIRLITRDVQKGPDPDKVTEITIEEGIKKKIFPNELQAYFVGKVFEYYQSIGIPYESLRFRHMLDEETPFYSKANFDLEISLDIGWKEVVGIAYRTNHDLSTHAQHSGTKIQAELQVPNQPLKKFVPHVVEPSFGVERTMYSVLEHSYRPKIPKGTEKKDPSDREWDWFQIPAHIAPFSAMVFPLMKKPELVEKTTELFKSLKEEGIQVFYDQGGAIGRRYARADEIGTPFCFTIDYETLEDGTVTIRDRDTMKQIRIKLEDCIGTIKNLLNYKHVFLDLGNLID
ncbi:MAG: glycine--tRNA ligase [Candidatus Hodarchaeota archaeon]